MLFLLVGCLGLNPRAVPTQDIYADDGEIKEWKESLQFAVLGDVRPAFPGESQARGRADVPGAMAAVVTDLSDEIQAERVRFAIFMGNLVRTSSTAEWKSFSKTFGLVLSGSELPEMGRVRVRSVPVAGADDRGGDERLNGWGAAFPGAGADIGYNRVASWYAFDVDVQGHVWRLIVLDSDRARLGSRWEEQMAWIPKAMDGSYESVLIFMHNPFITLAVGGVSNEGGGPGELIEAVEDATKLGAVKAIFAGHSGTNEVFLPTGKFGELYVNAGNAGAPAASLQRWGHAEGAKLKDVKIETIFDLALMREFDRWAEPRKFSQNVVEHAKADGAYKGFEGVYDAHSFPVIGWWNVAIEGRTLAVTFRILGDDDRLKDVWTGQYEGKAGWKIGG